MNFYLYFYIPVPVSVSVLLLCTYTLTGVLRIANYPTTDKIYISDVPELFLKIHFRSL